MRRLSPSEAAGIIRPIDSLSVPLGPGVPGEFLHALDSRDDFEDFQVNGALLPDLFGVFTKPGVSYRSGFFGPAERFLLSAGVDVQFVPSDFRGFISMLGKVNARVVATMASPPDADGWMSLSLHAGAHVAELRRAAADPDRICLLETSEQLPADARHRTAVPPRDPRRRRRHHRGRRLHPDQPRRRAPTEVEEAIAAFAVPFIPDGATLQTGIGGIPNTIATALAEGPGSGYGVHSEMFTSGLMRLSQAGKVTNENKGVYDGYSVTTFAAGVPELYEWLDGNEEVRFLPVEIINSPEIISANQNMVTINGAMAVDLSGQIVADTIGGTQFSGIGGHEDFVAGAALELSDRSLVCLPSSTSVDGELVSRITPKLPTGSVITTPRHMVDVVITEYGVAELRGLTVRERRVPSRRSATPRSARS